jgi:fructokinase
VILVAGEALYDLVLQGTDDRLQAHPGGGPFNTARTIGRLGQPVAYLGRLSRDRFGRRLEAILAEDGVDLRSIVRTDEPTTLALAEVDCDGVAQYRFYERGTSAPGLEPYAALAVTPADVSFVHVGTLGLALEPITTALEVVVERLAGRAVIAVDPNCRPWVVDDHDAYRARLLRVLSHSHVLKVSEDDVHYLEPGVPPVEGVRALLEHGPIVGLLTRGPNGAVVVMGTEEVPVPSPRAKIVDTIGAGDAFGGGFLAWWSERGLARDALTRIDTVVEAANFASHVARPHLLEAGRLAALPARAADAARNGVIPSTVDIRLRVSSPEAIALPWESPLAQWDPTWIPFRDVPVGPSRHLVRFVELSDGLLAIKEAPDRIVEREYAVLRRLEEQRLPAVRALGVVLRGSERDGLLVTRFLDHSWQFRRLFMRLPSTSTLQRDRLLHALAGLLVELHRRGVFWGDGSLANTLFVRSGQVLEAHLVDAETSEIHPRLSDGQRRYDLQILVENVAGGLVESRTVRGRSTTSKSTCTRRKAWRRSTSSCGTSCTVTSTSGRTNAGKSAHTCIDSMSSGTPSTRFAWCGVRTAATACGSAFAWPGATTTRSSSRR